MDTKLYINFIQNTLKTEGITVADKANKIALDSKQITIDQYSKAARIIAKAILDR